MLNDFGCFVLIFAVARTGTMREGTAVGGNIARLGRASTRWWQLDLAFAGFLAGLSLHDLCRLLIVTNPLLPGEGLSLFLSSSKTDPEHQGRTVSVPALKRLSLVQALKTGWRSVNCRLDRCFAALIAGGIWPRPRYIRTACPGCCAGR